MRKFLFGIVLSLLALPAMAQEKFTISGVVKDSANGEVMLGAIVKIEELTIGATTNEYGFFSIQVPKGTYTILVYGMGYKKIRQTITVEQSMTLNFEIAESAITTKEVVVKGKKEKEDANVQDTKMSTIQIDVKQMKKLPALFGEVDIIKNLQMMPGVQVAGEGNTGLYVRGGGADQNLILLDEAPVYNASHVFGIFSVFNSDAMKTAELYKGGIPAQHGGRLSSLLDIRSKDGNSKKFKATGGLGLISSRLTLEGPIVKDKASYIVSARRTYADMFLKLSSNPQFDGAKLYFYDLNAKINYNINEKNKVYLAGYFGKDVLQAAGFGIDWSNATGTARWNHIYGKKLFSNTTLVYSNFNYGLGVIENENDNSAEANSTAFRWVSNLKEITLKQDYTWFLNNNNEIAFGVLGSYKIYNPGELKPQGDNSIFRPFKMQSYYSTDQALYLSNKQKLSPRWMFEYGVRYSFFQNLGRDTVFTYNGTPDRSNITDTMVYGRGELIKAYNGFEPRVSGRFLINDASSIKFSYNRMFQYQHLLSNSASPLPTSQWIPSTNVLSPQKADQVAGGYFRNFKENTFEASAEVYYKWMHNVVDFKDNADLIGNNEVETEVRRGKGWSYGLELFVRKNKGKLTGWTSYTWSKTQFDVPDVNEGRAYYASYDRRHNVSVVLAYDISKKWNIAGNWVMGTGRPITMPTQKYVFGNSFPTFIPERNNYRIQAYHRMDLSATWHPMRKPERRFQSYWNFSLYNVYMRRNPFTVFVRDKNEGTLDEPINTGKKEVAKLWLFSIIPSITYNFTF
ncbi:MAG: TonB-dependent receptor [Cytophagaceae bacterium]|jgi:hypothetical protein|nr:TonB-dependent receptor [Cytophagaceae bacterium]